jgi:fimbrial isopeptide formation D2 family protein
MQQPDRSYVVRGSSRQLMSSRIVRPEHHSGTAKRKRTKVSNRNSVSLWKTGVATLAGAIVAMSFSVAPAVAAPLVDGSQTGSLTVHKFEKPPTITGGGGGNNRMVNTAGLVPLAGIEFTIQQVNTIDLSTNVGWDAAHNLSNVFSPADPEGSISGAGLTLGSSLAQTTDTDGTAAFGNLPVGLYLVTETNYPAGVTPSAPFLATIPTTDPDNQDNWTYDVHVYPKNSITGATKTVTDAPDIKLGGQIDFTITGDIPNETVIDGYKIVDVLDPKLTYISATATLVDGTVIAEGADYNVVFAAATKHCVGDLHSGRSCSAGYKERHQRSGGCWHHSQHDR